MKRNQFFVTCLLLLLIPLAILPMRVPGCTRAYNPFIFGELYEGAEIIVRATAVKYTKPPGNSNIRTTGVPDSIVEFKVEEVLRGKDVPESIQLKGYLGNGDDYNDRPVPYDFVRPGGRSGSCFANTYKQGAQFLLFLKKKEDGYTPNISALGPTNEQLHSDTDPWLIWVKDYLKSHEEPKKKITATGLRLYVLAQGLTFCLWAFI